MRQFLSKREKQTRIDVEGYACPEACMVRCNAACESGCEYSCISGCSYTCTGTCKDECGGLLHMFTNK